MDNLTPDINRIATDLIKDLAGSFWDKAKSLTGEQINKLKVALRIGMDAYAKESLSKISYVKTILYRDKNVHLSNFYVETLFIHQEKIVSQDGFFERYQNKSKVIVSGSAGCGKSIFMRYAALKFIDSTTRKIPIFVELRFINHSHSSILQFIHKEIIEPALASVDIVLFDYALQSGLFILLLDGFDELDFDRRSMYLQEVNYLKNRFKELSIIIATRPEDSTLALDGFDVFHVSPLSKTSSIKLIENLEFDEEIRTKFSAAMEQSIYETHTEFASNPLLLTMLLLTFDQVGNLPSKMHIFYNQAFEVLVFKHDRLKSLYTRKTYADLDIEQVRRIFSFICATAYFEGHISFTEMQLDELISDSLEFNQIKFSTESVKNDLIYSFCMMKRDGLYITFVHRSFQEYFAAYFMSRTNEIDLRDVINYISERGSSEQCIGLLFDMAPEKFDEIWLIPTSRKFIEECDVFVNQPTLFINEFFGGVQYSDGSIRLVSRNKKGRILETAIEIANLRLKSLGLEFPNIKREMLFRTDVDAIEKFFGGNFPYLGKAVEPTSEDNKWISASELRDYIACLKNALSYLVDELEQQSAVRRTKAKLFQKKRQELSVRVYTEDFEARGEPQRIVDQRTGEERIVPMTRRIARNVIRGE
jgi:hypothetical protein